MIQQLHNLKLDNVLVVDIETATAHKNIKKENPEMFQVFKYKHRNRETMELPTDKDAIKIYNQEGALSPIYGRIVCITVGTWKNNQFVTHSYSGNEVKILKNFLKLVKSRKFKLVGYNLRFDIPYIRKRCLHHGISDYLTPEQGLDVGVKPWEYADVVIDLMEILKGVSWMNDSLEETCLLLGVPSSKQGDCSGSKVSEYFHNGKIKEIIEYCEQDVIATAKVFLKLRDF